MSFEMGLTLHSKDIHFDESTKTALEKIVGKGEIARYEQISLFPTMFFTQIIVSSYFCPYF